jgi:SAM-dependent methyltransferase
MASLTTWLRTFGIDPKRSMLAMRGIGRFLAGRSAFRQRLGRDFRWAGAFPILDEWGAACGSLGAYFFQDQRVAQWIYEANPRRHVDVGSRLDGFIGHLSVFREVEVIDIRPDPAAVRNVTFHQLDLMECLPARWVECTDSLSCLHTIEHFGLGRYGDPIDVAGHLKGLAQLKRMVKPGGRLYLSTPIGPQRVEFNAHRVFAAATLAGWFAEGWEIERFALIDDDNRFHESVAWRGGELERHFGCQTGLGIVVARKTPDGMTARPSLPSAQDARCETGGEPGI